jgi:hypothetical protein
MYAEVPSTTDDSEIGVFSTVIDSDKYLVSVVLAA